MDRCSLRSSPFPSPRGGRSRRSQRVSRRLNTAGPSQRTDACGSAHRSRLTRQQGGLRPQHRHLSVAPDEANLFDVLRATAWDLCLGPQRWGQRWQLWWGPPSTKLGAAAPGGMRWTVCPRLPHRRSLRSRGHPAFPIQGRRRERPQKENPGGLVERSKREGLFPLLVLPLCWHRKP